MTSIPGERPYKQVARAEAQQRTREALCRAAVEEFYDGDWTKATLETLAARAGVTKQTLLRHFGSKDGLLTKALIGSFTELVDERWSAPQGNVEGAVDNLLDHYRDWGERAMRIGSWQSGPPELAMFSQGGRQFHYNWIDYAFAPQLKGLRAKDRARVRAGLIAICDVQTWWILSHDLAFERGEVRAILIRMIDGFLEGHA